MAFKDTVSGLVNTTTGGVTSPGSGTVISPSDEVKEQALYTDLLQDFLKRQYSIFLWDQTKGAVSDRDTFAGLDPATPSGPPEFFFNVAPKVTDFSEPFTTTIIPTQNGGKFVESHGSIIKNIRIQGTTGVRPDRNSLRFPDRINGDPRTGAARNIPIVGQAVDNISQQFRLSGDRRKAQSSEPTGFTQITFLANIFRAYSDIKEQAEYSNNIVMVFRNDKDGESWIVEPADFKRTRSSKSPLSYDYHITFRTLAPFSPLARNGGDDPLARILNVRKVFSRVQEFNQSLRRTFSIVSTQIRRLEGLGVFAQTQIMNPIINVTRGLGVIRATGSTFGRRLRLNAQTLSDNLDEAIDLLTGAAGVEEQDALVRSLRRARITAARILAEPGVRETASGESSERRERWSRAYTSTQDRTDLVTRTPDTGGSRTYLGNERNTTTFAQGTVHKDEDIRSAAGRLLGDRSRWQILATINNLKPPYFSSDGSGDTLAPGDSILFPAATGGVSGASLASPSTSGAETDSSKQGRLGPVQEAYGRDLRLRSVPISASGVALTDFSVNQSGDLSTIVGVPNAQQGVVLKFSTEQGELVPHPGYGASFPIGSKATPRAINTFKLQTEATILSDPRVRRISSIDFLVDGDTIFVQADVVLVDGSDGFNLFVPLRSA